MTYDAGALVAAERSDRTVWALHRRSLDRGLRPTVPAGALAQGWRGGPQAQLARLLKGCRVEVLDEARSRTAGAACARSGTADVIDASVVVGTAARGDLVVTSDRADLEQIATALGVSLEVVAV
ncbi:MAG TPA: hypothetical protein VFZ77_08790 [Acidimicrobiales bacterium]